MLTAVQFILYVYNVYMTVFLSIGGTSNSIPLVVSGVIKCCDYQTIHIA
jgi:hypothetical protein